MTIVIPVYNRAHTLDRLFASIEKVTWHALEIILVDNNSKDTSLEICRRFKERSQDKFLVEIYTESEQGACPCRNLGLQKAHGQYVYFFDSDDEMSPHYLSDAMQAVKSDTDIVCSPTQMFFSNGKIQTRRFYFTSRASVQILTASLSTQSILFKKSFIEKIGGWDVRLWRWNDWELGIRTLLNAPNIVWLKQPYHKIHQHPDSITGNSFSKDYTHLKRSIMTVRRLLENIPTDRKEHTASLNALSAKTYILSAQLAREEAYTEAKELRQIASRFSTGNYLLKILAPIICKYIEWGGIGGWKIFMLLT